MGTAAFVALLMTLCNKSFSATSSRCSRRSLRSVAYTLGRLPAGLSRLTAGRPSISSLSLQRCRGLPYCCCAGKRLSIPNAPQALCRVVSSRRPMRWRWGSDSGLPAARGVAGAADPQRAGLYVVLLPVRPAGGCRAHRRRRDFVRRPA